MPPEAQLAQHLAMQWIGGVLMALLVGIVAFSEWRHRITMVLVNAATKEALDAHNEASQAHALIVGELRTERAALFANIGDGIHRVELSLQKMVDRIEADSKRVDRLSKAISWDGPERRKTDSGGLCASCLQRAAQQQFKPQEAGDGEAAG